MTQEHPITPSQEVVHQWAGYAKGYNIPGTVIEYIATQAARWGADQELEACCQEVQDWYGNGSRLHTARRPKPPSLKEQALAALQVFGPSGDLTPDEIDALRRALESLPD